jgi:hypothetical protein
LPYPIHFLPPPLACGTQSRSRLQPRAGSRNNSARIHWLPSAPPVPGPPTLLPAAARAEVGLASVATARPDLNPADHAIPDGRAFTTELELRPAEHQLAQAAHPASPSLTSCSLTLDGETPSSPMGAAAGETPAALWAAARILSRAARAAPRNRPRLPPGIAAPAMGDTGVSGILPGYPCKEG